MTLDPDQLDDLNDLIESIHSMRPEKSNTDALRTLLQGSELHSSQTAASILMTQYGPLQPDFVRLQTEIKSCLPTLQRLRKTALEKLNPYHGFFSLGSADVDELSFLKFVSTLAQAVSAHIQNSTTRVQQMSNQLERLLPVLSGAKPPTAGNLTQAERSARELMEHIEGEVRDTLNGFEKTLAGIYLTTRREYRRLRKNFLGSAIGPEDKDPVEDELMMQFLGQRRAREDAKPGPAHALLDNNCVLTQTLLDAAQALPKVYQRTIAVTNRKGVATGRTRISRKLDEGEVEDYGRLLIHISHPTYLDYLHNPQTLLDTVMELLVRYYIDYLTMAELLKEILEHSGTQIVTDKPYSDMRMANPLGISRPYKRINFVAIQPDPDDVQPKTRAERDYDSARTKLLVHLRNSLTAISTMDREEESTEQYAVLQVNEAVKLKTAMDDVMKTQAQRALHHDIAGDNEFYKSKAGNLGSLEAERAPTPRITYEDVFGDSFIKAKEHVEEVVKVASHANVMRISAPRGDVKSNILLIGPPGCGKTEFARAVAADKRIIGFVVSIADMLTAYMHESVKNVKRLYEQASGLRHQSRDTKPVAVALDEFDRLFTFGEGVQAAYDGPRMEGTMQEMMDGVIGYEGVFLVAMTNAPGSIPAPILRRFKYVDVVGQLTRAERAGLFEKFLTHGLPIDPSIGPADYARWAEMLDDAPGDVIGKVADEVHFKFMSEFVDAHPDLIQSAERTLSKRLKDREMTEADRIYLKGVLAQHRTIGTIEITTALDATLKQPQVKMQIETAKEVYKDAEEILAGLSTLGKNKLGFVGPDPRKRSALWTRT